MKKISWRRLSILIATLGVVGGSVLSPIVVRADQYDDKINQLKQQNSTFQGALNGLTVQAQTYQEAIDRLQAQINQLQVNINANLAQQAKLKQQIADAQQKLDSDKKILGQEIRTMYMDDSNMSTIEMLATSNNLSDYVDKQEYSSMIQQKLQTILQQIAALQKQLKAKEQAVELLLKNLQNQRSQVAGAQAQQAKLLSYNQQQQSQYNAQLAANNSRIDQLREQQAAAIAAATGSGGRSAVGSSIQYKNMTGPQECGGGYRYCYNADGSYTWLDEWVNDPWGFGSARECVHYVLSSLANRGYYIPQFPAGGGNAYQWVPFTTSVGAASLVSNPQPGDVVYMPIGSLGHVAIVDWVNSDGTVHVSQMNWYPGMYNTMDLYITPGIQFLRFHKL